MNASVIAKTARQPHRTVFSECTLKQPLVSPITVGNVLCSAAAAWPSRAIDVVWNVAELDRSNRARSGQWGVKARRHLAVARDLRYHRRQ
jgi:hypothetical protein